MTKSIVWEPSEHVVKAFWERVRAVWSEQLAAVADGVPTIPSFEQTRSERKASLTFWYPKSSTTAYFRYADGAWSCVNYPND